MAFFASHEHDAESMSMRDIHSDGRTRRELGDGSRRDGSEWQSQPDSKLRREQELRIKAEQEQARLIGVNHDLTLLLDRYKQEGEDELREGKATIAELELKLEGLQEVHDTAEVALSKYRMRAEQVMRELEASQADQDKSRRRAEEALARTVAAAHSKLTAKTEALADAERTRTEETTARTRLQTQLEAFVAQRDAALHELDEKLANARARELDLSSKLSEANQRVEELTRRQALTDSNSLSLQALLASVGGSKDDKKDRESEREEWERIKRAAAQREAELTARLAEQNHIIRLLRQSLASSSSSSGSVNLPSVSPTPQSSSDTANMNTKIYDLQNKNEYLQHALDERDAKLKRSLFDLDEAARKIEKLESLRAQAPMDAIPTPLDEKRRFEEQLSLKNSALLEERKKHDEELANKNREIQTLREHIARLQKEVDVKSELAASAQGLQAEMDESHINEIKLLEQVEQYEFTVMQLRGRVAELERFIVEDTGGAFGTG